MDINIKITLELDKKIIDLLTRNIPPAITGSKVDELKNDHTRLEAIKTEVIKHAKRGKSADIKFLLSKFDANRVSELATEYHDIFLDLITRYGKGEPVEKIFPNDKELI